MLTKKEANLTLVIMSNIFGDENIQNKHVKLGDNYLQIFTKYFIVENSTN